MSVVFYDFKLTITRDTLLYGDTCSSKFCFHVGDSNIPSGLIDKLYFASVSQTAKYSRDMNS